MDINNPTRQDIYEAKALDRKLSAKQPFSEKWKIMLRMQWMHYQMKKAVGKRPRRPWEMPLEQYEAEWGEDK